MAIYFEDEINIDSIHVSHEISFGVEYIMIHFLAPHVSTVLFLLFKSQRLLKMK